MPSGPSESFAGQAIFGSSIMAGPGSSRSSTCSTIFSDSRISATRTTNRDQQSPRSSVGTSKSNVS